MKKILLVLTILFVSCTFTVYDSKANDLNEPQAEDFGLFLRQVPVVCGEFRSVIAYLTYYDFKPTYTSVGKEGAQVDGRPVFGMILYFNKNKTESIAVMGVPNDPELCMMYRTFELKEFNAED